MDSHWHVGRLDLLGVLSPGGRDRFRAAASRRDYEKGTPVFGPTPDPKKVFLVESGQVRLFRMDGEGRQVTLAYVREGESFGEVHALTGHPRESHAVARQPSTVWGIPNDAFLEVLESEPGAVVAVTKELAGQVHTLQERLADLVFRPVGARLAAALVRIASEHGTRDEGGLSLGLSLTHDDLAALVGTTRQSVSEQLAALRDAGIVGGGRQARQLRIRDEDALRAVAKGERR